MRHTAGTARELRAQHSIVDRTDKSIQLIVLDDDDQLLRAVEDSLWMWPRQVVAADHIEDAIKLCQASPPDAILIAIDRSAMRETKALPALRRRLPKIPIVAVVSIEQSTRPGQYVESGADALLLREDAHRPALYTLLQRIQRPSTANETVASSRLPKLELPWANSRLLGALICDSSGAIVDANREIARMLRYDNVETLRSQNVGRDILANPQHWESWVEVAFDSTMLCHRNVPLSTADGRVVCAEIEVFALPSDPQFLQAAFVGVGDLANGRRSRKPNRSIQKQCVSRRM